MADFMSSASFGQLRSQARTLESQTEIKLLQYSGFSQSPGPIPTEEESAIGRELEQMLAKVILILSQPVDSNANLL